MTGSLKIVNCSIRLFPCREKTGSVCKFHRRIFYLKRFDKNIFSFCQHDFWHVHRLQFFDCFVIQNFKCRLESVEVEWPVGATFRNSRWHRENDYNGDDQEIAIVFACTYSLSFYYYMESSVVPACNHYYEACSIKFKAFRLVLIAFSLDCSKHFYLPKKTRKPNCLKRFAIRLWKTAKLWVVKRSVLAHFFFVECDC